MTPQDKNDIINACEQVSRPGLYIMVFICLMHACDDTDPTSRLDRIERALQRIEDRIENTITNMPAKEIAP